MTLKYIKVAMFIVIILVLAVAVPAQAMGPGGGGGGGGGPGGGGGGHTETATNNLSWPTIMIGGIMNLTDPALVMPSGTPATGYEVPGYYYVQGVHKWQAEWMTATSGVGTAAWGDNLIGQAKKTVGSPIRVELGLFDATGVSMQGFPVVKLEPLKLDRESKYGTLAVSEDGGLTYHGTAQALTPARIYDAGVTFSVEMVGGDYVVPVGSSPTAEINSTGKVVYGYNLRVSAAGQYEITFVIPNVTITGVNGGGFTDHTVTLVITVGGGSGGGGGGGRPR